MSANITRKHDVRHLDKANNLCNTDRSQLLLWLQITDYSDPNYIPSEVLAILLRRFIVKDSETLWIS